MSYIQQGHVNVMITSRTDGGVCVDACVCRQMDCVCVCVGQGAAADPAAARPDYQAGGARGVAVGCGFQVPTMLLHVLLTGCSASPTSKWVLHPKN